MDKIVSTGIVTFIVILVAFAGVVTYTGYTETAYRNTLAGNTSYTCTITTDAPLYNVTFFLPVPADTAGNSPVVSAFSGNTVKGVPEGWETTLFDTGKATLVKITTPAIIPPAGTSPSSPYTITLSSTTVSRTPVDTRNPVESAVFRPVQALTAVACPQGLAGGNPQCFTYTTSLYADYIADPQTTVTIASSVTGKNSWTVFGEHSNEYNADAFITMTGEHKGWASPECRLSGGIGTYENIIGA